MKSRFTVMYITLILCFLFILGSTNSNPVEPLETENVSLEETRSDDSTNPEAEIKTPSSPYPVQPRVFVDVDIPFLSELTFDSVSPIHDFYDANIGEKTYIIDLEGKVLKVLNYLIRFYSKEHDFAVAEHNGLFGVIDRKFEQVLPFEYKLISDIQDNMVYATNDSFSGYINLTNKKKIPLHFRRVTPRYDKAYTNTNNFYEGLALVYDFTGAPSYFMNTQGESVIVLPKGVKDCSIFSSGIAGYRFFDDMTVFINTKGEELFRREIKRPFAMHSDAEYLSQDFYSFPLFKNGYIHIYTAAWDEGYWLNEEGKEVDPPDLSVDLEFDLNPMAGYGGIGYVDKHENFVIPPQFAIGYSFHNGRAFVETLTKTEIIDNEETRFYAWAVIDEKGFFVIPYQQNGSGLDNILIVNGKWRIIDVKKLNPTVVLNGSTLTFNNYPQLVKGNVLIPASGIEDNFYCQVTTNNDEIKIKHYNKVIKAKSGSTTYYLNGVEKQASVAPFFLNGEALIPIDYLKDLIHFNSSWSEKERKLEIIMK